MSEPRGWAELEKAKTLANEALINALPNREIPAWILLNSSVDGRLIDEGLYRFEMVVWKSEESAPSYSWRIDENGGKWLTPHHSEARQNTITISHDVPDDHRISLFEMEVDLPKGEAIVTKTTDLATLQPEDIYLNADYFDFSKMWRFDLSNEQNQQAIFPGRLKR